MCPYVTYEVRLFLELHKSHKKAKCKKSFEVLNVVIFKHL